MESVQLCMIMMFWELLLKMLKLVKDSDGDGRPDITDDFPDDPDRK